MIVYDINTKLIWIRLMKRMMINRDARNRDEKRIKTLCLPGLWNLAASPVKYIVFGSMASGKEYERENKE